jgi:hypothetical protein
LINVIHNAPLKKKGEALPARYGYQHWCKTNILNMVPIPDKNPGLSYNKDTKSFNQKRRIKMKGTMKFLASRNGRIVRIVVGAALVILGIFGLPNSLNWLGIILIIVGLVPLLAGIFDVCVFAPLFKLPLSGKKIRAG